MKIITSNKISAVSTAGGELDATNYPDDNVLTDKPNQVYIATGGQAAKFVLTCTLSANSDGFFLYNWLADSVEYSTNGGGAYTQLSSAGENYISDNLQMNLNNNILTKPLFTVVALTSANDLLLRFQTTVDRKAQQVSGNAIDNFLVTSGSTGNFRDSSNATINTDLHGRIMIGSHIDISGTVHQVTKIIGDGTTAGAITLSGTPASNTIDAIYNPVKIGIVRAGTIEAFENAQPGLQRQIRDFSITRQLTNGGISYKNRNTKELWEGSLKSNLANSDAFLSFARAFRAKPFPCLVLNGMPSAQNEDSNYSVYAQLAEMPETNYFANGAVREINFRLREV